MTWALFVTGTMGYLASGGGASAQTATGVNFDPHKYEWAASLGKSASVRFDGGVWEFAANPAGEGLRVRGHVGGAPREFTLSFDGAIGQVIAVCASTLERDEQLFITVGVAGVQPGSDQIEYRLLQGRKREGIEEEKGWIYTLPLMTRPLDHPHSLMSVSQLGGDSLMMTVQTVERISGGSENRIETHTFLSHCPIPGAAGPRIFRTAHYTSSTQQRQVERQGDEFVP